MFKKVKMTHRCTVAYDCQMECRTLSLYWHGRPCTLGSIRLYTGRYPGMAPLRNRSTIFDMCFLKFIIAHYLMLYLVDYHLFCPLFNLVLFVVIYKVYFLNFCSSSLRLLISDHSNLSSDLCSALFRPIYSDWFNA